MINIINILRPDDCPKCNNQRCIELFDIYNKPKQYSIQIDRNDRGMTTNIDTRTLSHFKCKLCKEEFKIDFSKGERFPEPLKSDTSLRFQLDKLYNNRRGRL